MQHVDETGADVGGGEGVLELDSCLKVTESFVVAVEIEIQYIKYL